MQLFSFKSTSNHLRLRRVEFGSIPRLSHCMLQSRFNSSSTPFHTLLSLSLFLSRVLTGLSYLQNSQIDYGRSYILWSQKQNTKSQKWRIIQRNPRAKNWTSQNWRILWCFSIFIHCYSLSSQLSQLDSSFNFPSSVEIWFWQLHIHGFGVAFHILHYYVRFWYTQCYAKRYFNRAPRSFIQIARRRPSLELCTFCFFFLFFAFPPALIPSLDSNLPLLSLCQTTWFHTYPSHPMLGIYYIDHLTHCKQNRSSPVSVTHATHSMMDDWFFNKRYPE